MNESRMLESPKSTRVVLALGANLGQRLETIRTACQEISQIAGVEVDWVSPLVESIALTLNGNDESAPKYLNCVMQVQVGIDPLELLHALQAIELTHGRVRNERWQARTLDIDIVQFGDVQSNAAELTLPHPEAFRRNFVLYPWWLADPAAELVGYGAISGLTANSPDELTVLETVV